MERPVFVGATAAAALPAALAAAVFVSVPFAGTTTRPLAHHHTVKSRDRQQVPRLAVERATKRGKGREAHRARPAVLQH